MSNQSKIASLISSLLTGKSATFAQIEYVTPVKTAARHKYVLIEKHTTANVQLFANIKAATDVFLNAVKKSATKIEGQSLDVINNFTSSGNYYNHTECYSIVKHNDSDKLYLWAIFNNATSHFLIDGLPATREQVAEFLTPSERKKLLEKNSLVHNVKNDLLHNVQVRTVSLSNIKNLKAVKTEIKFH